MENNSQSTSNAKEIVAKYLAKTEEASEKEKHIQQLEMFMQLNRNATTSKIANYNMSELRHLQSQINDLIKSDPSLINNTQLQEQLKEINQAK